MSAHRLSSDALAWLVASEEPAARWVALTGLQGLPEDHPEARRARAAVLAHAGTEQLFARLGDWEEAGDVGGHDSPRYLPNLLGLLHDMGVRAGDDPRVEAALDAMLRHQAADGRFLARARWRQMSEPVWAGLVCDHHAVTEVLLRFERGGDARVAAALELMVESLATTAQGRGWLCVADPELRWRGPGRKADVCLQVTLEALRVFSHVPVEKRPDELLAAGHTSLRVWRQRSKEQPYMFGHGKRFKRVKWPPTWYGAFAVLDAVGRYPELWEGQAADADDRRAVAEIAACLIAYNVDPGGLVTPRSCYRGFETHSFGQKTAPSPFASARLWSVLRPFSALADEIARVDVTALSSSKGGRGLAVPP